MARFLLGLLLTAVGHSVSWGEPAPAGPENGRQRLFSTELQRVRILIKANVLDLAQSILENDGPTVLPTQEWFDWERQIWALYRTREQWDRLYDRTRQVPADFPAAVRTEADIQAVTALNELKQGERARVLLRRHLLSNSISEFIKRKLRKMLVESYLADDLLYEASVAMRNYQLDYRSREEDWLLLSAQVLLKLGDADAAVNLLAPLDQPASRLLRIYARLSNGSVTPEQAIARAKDLLTQVRAELAPPKRMIGRILSVIALATGDLDKPDLRVEALEQYMVATGHLPEQKPWNDLYPHYHSTDLVDAYKAVALDEANLSGLLVGDPAHLLQHAVHLAPELLTRKKSIYGYLIGTVPGPDFRLELNNLYVDTLIKSGRTEIVSQLYGEGKPFGELEIGGDTGLELSNLALENGNVQLAAMVNQRLTETPQRISMQDWWLHRSRVSIIAGDYEQGSLDLKTLIASYDRLTQEETDKILQPIFDLQAIRQHQRAIELLLEVDRRTHSVKQKREVAYWMAQSYQATRQFTKAADYYLYSALQKANGFDEWGRAARFQAAESLLSANLFSDSRAILEDLLKRATEENRKVQLKQKLQGVWLLESNLTGTASGQE
ncbi:MAG: hypothetical protein OXG56_11785 [Gammaproteobacteria bacterium]|nr:hypothetical protein [Gammaproteobacteria bacterium]